jgi:hypothetical protein
MNSTLISLIVILSTGLVAWSLAELVRWIDRRWARMYRRNGTL